MKCRLCVAKYHYQCLNIDKHTFINFTKEYASTWICASCSNVTRRTHSNDNTPMPCLDDSMNMSCDLSEQNQVTMEKISTLLDEKLHASLSVFMSDFRKILREDVKQMVKIEMESAMKTIKEDFSATTDFICAEQSTLRADIDKNDDVIKSLETENNNLKSEIIKLNNRLAGIEKISRNCNIELQAVPERKNENVLLLFKKICDVIKVSVDDGHINACRRVAKQNAASNRPRNIVVTLSSPRIRDIVLSASSKYNKAHSAHGLTSRDLEIPGESCRIFVTEHLSPEQKALHAAARKAAKELSYKYVWVKYGQIYIRKDDSASAILIKNMDSLNKLR